VTRTLIGLNAWLLIIGAAVQLRGIDDLQARQD
jgi:hypothetical protein